MGLDVIQGDHEDAPGQLELNFMYDDVLRNDDRLTTGREELLIEMTNFAKQIANIEAKVNVLRDASYKTASIAELQAMEELVRNTADSMREFTYTIKELERKLDGGY